MFNETLRVASPDEIAQQVADEVTDLIRTRRDQGRAAVLALPAGSTPRGIYAELGRRHREEGLSFEGVTVFALDEYLGLPSAHPQTFRRFFERELFRPVGLPEENGHLLDCDLHPDQVESHCADFERAIHAVGGLDLALLGLGINGHVGFNEPGSARDGRSRRVELSGATREHAAPAFGGLQHVPLHALTMGLGTIREARAVRLVVAGESKREALGRILASPASSAELPATQLAGHPNLAILADPAALQSS